MPGLCQQHLADPLGPTTMLPLQGQSPETLGLELLWHLAGLPPHTQLTWSMIQISLKSLDFSLSQSRRAMTQGPSPCHPPLLLLSNYLLTKHGRAVRVMAATHQDRSEAGPAEHLTQMASMVFTGAMRVTEVSDCPGPPH